MDGAGVGSGGGGNEREREREREREKSFLDKWPCNSYTFPGYSFMYT